MITETPTDLRVVVSLLRSLSDERAEEYLAKLIDETSRVALERFFEWVQSPPNVTGVDIRPSILKAILPSARESVIGSNADWILER